MVASYISELFENEIQFSIQSDAIESYINRPLYTTQKPYIMITSTYCNLYDGWVPMIISIMIGKAEGCQKKHFYSLLKNYPFKTVEEFSTVFHGNTSDMEIAQLNGFVTAVELLINERKPSSQDAWINVGNDFTARSWRCCEVHFKRNVTKLCSMTDIVPREHHRHVYNSIMLLLSEHISLEEFNKVIVYLLKQFPRTANWLKWHFQCGMKARILFPVLKKEKLATRI